MTTTLPPLPLVDNVLYIDNTMLETYTTCPRSFEYAWLQKRRSAEDKAALDAGTAFHLAMEARYKRPDLEIFEVNKVMLEAIHAFYAEHPAPIDDYRNESFVSDLALRYNAYYPTEPWRVMTKDGNPLVECTFAEPFGVFEVSFQKEPILVMWTGKIDLVTEWPDESIWTIDHKTSSRLGSTYWNDYINSQPQEGYVWAARRILGLPVKGFVMNVIGSHPFSSKKSDDERFLRQRFEVTDDKLDEWYHDVSVNIQDMLDDYGRQYYVRRTEKHCNGKYGKCQFLNVCQIPRANRKVMLDSNMYQENTWSPLKQEEEAK